MLRKREVKQGPMTIQLGVDAANKATGTMSMNGSDKPLSVELGGPLFGDAAGSNQVIAALPLAEGYSATFRNLDLQKQKVRLMQLKVAGSEQVTVPAGHVRCLEGGSDPGDGGSDKSTVWIAKDSRKPVKISSVMASMGGAVLTAEFCSKLTGATAVASNVPGRQHRIPTAQ